MRRLAGPTYGRAGDGGAEMRRVGDWLSARPGEPALKPTGDACDDEDEDEDWRGRIGDTGGTRGADRLSRRRLRRRVGFVAFIQYATHVPWGTMRRQYGDSCLSQ